MGPVVCVLLACEKRGFLERVHQFSESVQVGREGIVVCLLVRPDLLASDDWWESDHKLLRIFGGGLAADDLDVFLCGFGVEDTRRWSASGMFLAGRFLVRSLRLWVVRWFWPSFLVSRSVAAAILI